MAEKSRLAGSVGVTVFFGVYWDQYQQHPTGISLFQTISRHNPILTGLRYSHPLILAKFRKFRKFSSPGPGRNPGPVTVPVSAKSQSRHFLLITVPVYPWTKECLFEQSACVFLQDNIKSFGGGGWLQPNNNLSQI